MLTIVSCSDGVLREIPGLDALKEAKIKGKSGADFAVLSKRRPPVNFSVNIGEHRIDLGETAALLYTAKLSEVHELVARFKGPIQRRMTFIHRFPSKLLMDKRRAKTEFRNRKEMRILRLEISKLENQNRAKADLISIVLAALDVSALKKVFSAMHKDNSSVSTSKKVLI